MPRRVFGERVLDTDWLISEGNGEQSRGQGVLAADAVNTRLSGTVLGKVTATGQLAPYNPAGADGTQNFEAILLLRQEASATTTRVSTIERNAEVNDWKLTYVNALTAPQKATLVAAAAAKGILIRT
jgi:hypothetical protein